MNTTRIQPRPSKATTSRKHVRDLMIAIIGLLLLNGAMTVFSLWNGFWWAAALVNFTLTVILADSIGYYVPEPHKLRYERLLAVIFPLILLVSWEIMVQAGILNARWFPPPTKIAVALRDLTLNYDRFNESSLLGRPWLASSAFASDGWPGVWALFTESHVLATLARVFAGFTIGALPGVVLGMIMGINRSVRTMLDGTMSAIYVLPKIAIFPIMMLIFPNPFGEGPKIAVVAISAFFLVAISTMAGVRDIDPVYLQAGRNYGANRWQMFRHIIFPAALPVIFGGLRLALGTALIVIVAVEFVRADRGVGWIILYYWQVLVVEKMYAGLLVVMLLGVLLTYSLQWIEQRIMPWRRE